MALQRNLLRSAIRCCGACKSGPGISSNVACNFASMIRVQTGRIQQTYRSTLVHIPSLVLRQGLLLSPRSFHVPAAALHIQPALCRNSTAHLCSQLPYRHPRISRFSAQSGIERKARTWSECCCRRVELWHRRVDALLIVRCCVLLRTRRFLAVLRFRFLDSSHQTARGTRT